MSVFTFTDLAKELVENSKEEGLSFEELQKSWNEAEDVRDVVAALESRKVVHYLKLNGNTLGVGGAAAIGKALEKHPEFRKALWKDMFTGRLKAEIPQALKHLGKGLITASAQLAVLDLSDNALGPNGMAGLEELLRSAVCYTLQELRLNNCGLGIGGGQMLSKAILDCHRNSTDAGKPLNLKVFVAGRNRLENDGAKAIAKMFATVKTLEEITMPQNSIYHQGVALLADGIKHNPNLKVLNLNDNTVGCRGASHLADAFALLPRLREINFGDCLLKTSGAYNFAEALEENHHDLEVVNLGFNDIGSDGGVVLVTALKDKPKLRTLILDGNQTINPNESVASNKNTAPGLTTYETFCLSQKPCSLQMFESLGDSDKFKGFMEIINQFQGDDHLLLLIFTALKCAHLAQSSAEALELATILYQETINYAIKNKQERRITNYLLMQLGLLHCEEKFHTEYNKKSCRFALRQTLSSKSIDSAYMKNTFQVFLNNLDV
uniref:Ran-GTPase activating protein 1 C-terminal domain-containing protein n=1 Tax=Glossina brevipalpis TaxID=37001 RepID=A0A1A9X068_9MUSC